jgi:dihydroorotate dehydrogenase
VIYRLVFNLVLKRLDAERAHHLGAVAMRALTALPGVRRFMAPRDPALRVQALGLEFPSPLGVAGGFDKDGSTFGALGALGFGFVEVGTVTAVGQPGNDRPRVFRLPADRALVNRMGFPNPGADAVAERLRRRRPGQIVGINIGKTKVAEDAVADYRASAEKLGPLADFVVVNVSSPNTPGLRNLQAADQLRPIMEGVRAGLEAAGAADKPVLVKIAPDLDESQLDEIADLALELELAGIVATNTTIGRGGLSSGATEVEGAGAGGLSGAPLRQRSLEVLRHLRSRVGERLVLVSVGGIETADDAWERLAAGATLVQGYTGFIYGGPLWARRINRGLASRVRERGPGSVTGVHGISTAVAGVFPDSAPGPLAPHSTKALQSGTSTVK